MKKIVLLLMLGFAVGAQAQQKKPITVTINTPSVQCDMCKNKIEEYLKYEEGVTKVIVNPKQKKTTVTYLTDRTNLENIKTAIANVGYDAEEIKAAWAKSDALDDVTLEFIDCPDRRLANAALDYAIRMTEKNDVELTLLLPRRSYSGFLGRLLHDQTAEEIAAPISQLQRVVATIVPFDVDRITSASQLITSQQSEVKPVVAVPQFKPVKDVIKSVEPMSHYAENMTQIGEIQWRKRAHVQGRVTSIKSAPRGSAPMLQVEVWDQTGGVTLQFLGRREIAGLEVGSQLRAEGMVGEEEGALTILNPSYELLA